jgi:hypothetical protein
MKCLDKNISTHYLYLQCNATAMSSTRKELIVGKMASGYVITLTHSFVTVGRLDIVGKRI